MNDVVIPMGGGTDESAMMVAVCGATFAGGNEGLKQIYALEGHDTGAFRKVGKVCFLDLPTGPVELPNYLTGDIAQERLKTAVDDAIAIKTDECWSVVFGCGTSVFMTEPTKTKAAAYATALHHVLLMNVAEASKSVLN